MDGLQGKSCDFCVQRSKKWDENTVDYAKKKGIKVTNVLDSI